jgi:hypothetical protein
VVVSGNGRRASPTGVPRKRVSPQYWPGASASTSARKFDGLARVRHSPRARDYPVSMSSTTATANGHTSPPREDRDPPLDSPRGPRNAPRRRWRSRDGRAPGLRRGEHFCSPRQKRRACADAGLASALSARIVSRRHSLDPSVRLKTRRPTRLTPACPAMRAPDSSDGPLAQWTSSTSAIVRSIDAPAGSGRVCAPGRTRKPALTPKEVSTRSWAVVSQIAKLRAQPTAFRTGSEIELNSPLLEARAYQRNVAEGVARPARAARGKASSGRAPRADTSRR